MKRWILLAALVAAVAAAGLAPAAPDRNVVPNPDRTFAPVTLPPVPAREYLVSEGFETAVPPTGWTLMTSGEATTWEQTSGAANTGQYSAAVFYGPQGAWQDEWLVTPALDTQGLTSLLLVFAETQVDWDGYGYQHDVMVSTTVPDDPAAFTSVLTMTPNDHPIGNDWQEVTVDLSAYVGLETVYVALRYQGEWADVWYVDDVMVYRPYDHDARAVSVSPAAAIVFPESEITPEFTVKNMGGNTETFDVNMLVMHEGTVILDETLTVTDLPTGEQATVAFSPFLTELGDYVLTGTTLLVGDEYPDNDMAVGGVQCLEGERTPFGVLYTNWGCGPCVAANQALDAWYPLQGNNACLIRVHVWWPSGNDPMYLANTDQCDWMLAMCPTDVNGVPTLYMDNTWDMWDYFPGTWEQAVVDGYLMSATTPSAIAIPYLGFNPDTEEVELFVDVLEALDPQGDYRLFVAISEDGIEAQGPNGEPVHNQAFRWLFPGTEGMPVGAEPGMQAFTVPVALDPGWVFDNLRATVWVMEHPGGLVLNSATMFLSEGGVAIEDDGQAEPQVVPQLETRLAGASPNPFNPQTTIRFSLAREQAVKLAVFDLSGRRIVSLVDEVVPAGHHPVVWNGRDAAGQEVPSGVYLAHMVCEDGIQAAKLMLIR